MTETIGQAIRRLREEKGWSMRAMAKNVGVRHSWIAQIETGNVSSPRVDTANVMLNTLGYKLAIVPMEDEADV